MDFIDSSFMCGTKNNLDDYLSSCKKYAQRYSTVTVWHDGESLDAGWFGVPTNLLHDTSGDAALAGTVDKTSGSGIFWSNQNRYNSMNLEVKRVSGIQQRFKDKQVEKYGRATRDGAEESFPGADPKTNPICMQFNDPESPLHEAGGRDNNGRCRGRRCDDDDDDDKDEERSAQDAALEAANVDEHLRMGNPRWHWNGDNPPFDKSFTDTVDYLEKTTSTSGGENREFPDLSMTVNDADRTNAKFSASFQAPLRSQGYGFTLHKRNSPQAQVNDEVIFQQNWYHFQQPLYDDVWMMSAHSGAPYTPGGDELLVRKRQLQPGNGNGGNGNGANANGVYNVNVSSADYRKPSGNCRLDFVTPISNMQMHTLVSSIANGVRMKAANCDALPSPTQMNAGSYTDVQMDTATTPATATAVVYKDTGATGASEVAKANAISSCVNNVVVQSEVMAMVSDLTQQNSRGVQPFVFWMSVITPVLAMIWFPVMTTSIGYEKNRGLLEMMKIQSMDMATYWVANYIWFYFLYASVLIAYFYLVHEYVEVMYDYRHIAFIHSLWGHSLIGIAIFLSSVFANAESLTGITYFFMILTLFASLILGVALPPPWVVSLDKIYNYVTTIDVNWAAFENSETARDQSWFKAENEMYYYEKVRTLAMFFPPSNYVRLLVIVLSHYLVDRSAVIGDFELWDDLSEIEKIEYSTLLWLQFVVGTTMLALGICIHMSFFSSTIDNIRSYVSGRKGKNAQKKKDLAAEWRGDSPRS